MIKKTSWSCNKPLATSLSSRSVRFSASLQLEDFSRHSRFQAPELEEAIRKHFLPALLGVPSVEIDGDYRQLLTHSVKLGGLAIGNPVDTAPRVHKASLAATRHLTMSLVDPATRFDPEAHRMCATEAGAGALLGVI